MNRRPLLIDVALGALAGAAATWLMDKVTTSMYERESEDVRRRENKARGNKTAYQVAAEKGGEMIGVDFEHDESEALGELIHWGLGIGAGAFYGALRNVIPSLGIGSGLAYGAAFWLTMDEITVPALGLTPGPRAFPWQTHVRGLAGHVVLGGAIEAVFDLADAGS
ncbi:MAG TPA: DUF1440 domain-containing protein [Thermoanaerobaculia bacterium]|nr:DUF1440 domain-containing protein [Thermoanaerobaculia bacterium]